MPAFWNAKREMQREKCNKRNATREMQQEKCDKRNATREMQQGRCKCISPEKWLAASYFVVRAKQK
jgi:hypothetical protein